MLIGMLAVFGDGRLIEIHRCSPRLQEPQPHQHSNEEQSAALPPARNAERVPAKRDVAAAVSNRHSAARKYGFPTADSEAWWRSAAEFAHLKYGARDIKARQWRRDD